MIAKVAESRLPFGARTDSSPLWTEAGCLHAGKLEMVRFLAKETGSSYTALVEMSKEALAERLCALLNESEPAAEQAARHLPVVLGLTPRELEAALGCTRTERRRWVAEGRLPICATMRMFLKTGRWVDVKLVDRRAVALLAPDELERWRAEHQQLISERRRDGVLRGLEHRAHTLALQRHAVEEVSDLQARWREQSDGNLLLVAALTAAHWTVWASRRAKWHREAAPHPEQQRRWYGYKDQALRLLYHTGWLVVRWYQPDMLWVESLCDAHYDDWCEERTFLHSSFGEYVAQHEKELSRCQQCSRDPFHYALYSLELRPPASPDRSYRFHVPYSIGRHYLPEPESLAPVLEDEASEGLFRFGRPLQGEEAAEYSAAFLERQLISALRELRALLAGREDRLLATVDASGADTASAASETSRAE